MHGLVRNNRHQKLSSEGKECELADARVSGLVIIIVCVQADAGLQFWGTPQNGMGRDIEDRVAYVSIRRLRDRIEADDANWRILAIMLMVGVREADLCRRAAHSKGGA